MSAPHIDTARPPLPASASPTAKRSVPCRNCRTRLSYPATLRRGSTILSCARCGAGTKIPSGTARALKIACIFFYLCLIVLFYLIAKNQL